MKNKIALASAFVAASSLATAEIVINDFLSFEGFVDMSYAHSDAEVGSGAAPVKESENSYDIDQVEISWLFDFDPVTAQIDLAHEGTDGDYQTVEQAFATYHMDNGSAITAGRFASMLGFEAFEPTGLYQNSFAYTGSSALDQALDLFDNGLSDGSIDSDSSVLPGYNQGVKYTYEADNTFFGISLLDGDYNRARLGGDDGAGVDGGYGIEAAGALTMDNGVSFFLGGRYDDGDLADKMVYNAYVTFETGAWIFAAELAYADEDADAANADKSGLNALLMANFAYSDVASVTGRLSYVDLEKETGVGTEDDASFLKYTLAHNYSFTDNLLLVTELSYIDGELGQTGAPDDDVEELAAAVELVFSF